MPTSSGSAELGEHLVEVAGVGGTFLRLAQEDEAGALGARVRAQDLGQLRGVDQREIRRRDDHVGHVGERRLEGGRAMGSEARREAARGAGRADLLRPGAVPVRDQDRTRQRLALTRVAPAAILLTDWNPEVAAQLEGEMLDQDRIAGVIEGGRLLLHQLVPNHRVGRPLPVVDQERRRRPGSQRRRPR